MIKHYLTLQFNKHDMSPLRDLVICYFFSMLHRNHEFSSFAFLHRPV